VAANLLEQGSVRASDIKHTVNRARIATEQPENCRRVAQPLMGLVELTVGAHPFLLRYLRTVQNLDDGAALQLP